MEKRNGFTSGIGFVLAAAGGSVGLGNLWSFPYKTSQNGGAAFVFVYIISVIILGSILMIAEMYIGKRASANPVSAYKKINKNLGWVGLLGIVVSIFISFYYIVLGGYTLKYTVNSFFDNSNLLQTFPGNIWEVILFSGIFLLLALIIISFGIKNGIEKASKILMPILLLILIGIVIYCLCLGNGVEAGLNYYLNPNFEELGFKGILAAMSQAFFSLSVGVGALLAYGSYAGKEIKLGMSALWIAFFDTFVALLAGLAIFPAIYHYQAETGIELQNNGIVLMFSSLPIVFETLGVVGKIVSFFFFGMVSIAAITSIISMMEVASQFIIQLFKIKRIKACLIVGISLFVFSIPIGISLGFSLTGKEGLKIIDRNLLEVLDLSVTSLYIPFCALFAALSIGWLLFRKDDKILDFNFKNLNNDLENEGLNLGKFGKIFSFMIKYLIPLLIFFVEIMGIIDIIFPQIDGSRSFSLSGLIVEIIAITILAIIIVLYFVFLKNIDTGNNEDEIKLETSTDNLTEE